MKDFDYKTIFKVLVAFTLITMFMGCEDFLEENPESNLGPENFPQSAEDADLIVGGMTRPLYRSVFASRAFVFVAGVSDDEMTVYNTSGDRYDMDQYTYTTDNIHIRQVYETCYQVINQANSLVAYLPSDQEWAKPYIATGRYYRSWMYSYLVRLYGPSILRDTPTEEINFDEEITKASEEEIYNFIINDLEEAINDLPLNWTGNDARDDGRPTQGAAKMLLAKMYISSAGYPVNNSENWVEGLNKAQEVIDSGVYNLMPDYEDMFLIANQNKEESVFSIQVPITEGLLSMSFRPRQQSSGIIDNQGWYLFCGSEDLLNIFSDNDDRKEGTFLINLEQEPSPPANYLDFRYSSAYGPVPGVQKYQDFDRDNISDYAFRSEMGIKVFRYAEAFLIKAEAENEVNGPTAVAIEAVNVLRRRANMDEISIGLSQSELREIIHQEWTFEFAYEFKRRFNILRWGIIDDVLSSDPRAINGYAPYKKYFPIPQSAFDSGLDPSLQNPGY